MNPQSHTPSNPQIPLNPLIDHPPGLQQLAPASSDATVLPTAADRLYQIAALTAGLFLLFTLL
ncbi:hypothetical protein [Granulicella sp. L60]|jgi:hypothetical protein|uniref:hypothetical protein n=1 Tax=Granulicella sp. L60 TaxID=1641866 RepID=UPI00131A8955|nr:hypothetical protein [Granulicella sp. L60]